MSQEHVWRVYQTEQAKYVESADLRNWSVKSELRFVGGVDISSSGNSSVAGLVVFSFPELDIVYTDTAIVDCSQIPYIPGFLGFREAPAVLELVQKMKRALSAVTARNFVLMVDGNGILHERGFGSACHIGLAADVICIGVAKNFYFVESVGLTRKEANAYAGLTKKGDWKKLDPLAAAIVKSSHAAIKPIFVSVGHKISIESAVELVVQCSKFRVPEPTRYADIVTRGLVKELV